MKTIKILAVIFSAIMLLFACEKAQEPEQVPFKNNGPTLESRLCGVWNLSYYIPTSCAPEYSCPRERKGTTVVIGYIGDEIVYRQYNNYTGKTQRDCSMTFVDTIYHKDANVYSGDFILCDSIEVGFLLRQDTLRLYHTSTNGNEILGGSINGFIKELD